MEENNSEENRRRTGISTTRGNDLDKAECQYISGKYVVVNNITETQKNPHINTEQLIERYQTRNENFVETEGFKEAKYILLKKHMVIITGLPGDGKSSVAIQLLLTFMGSYQIVKLRSIQEFDANLNCAENQIFLLDDVLGKLELDKNNLEKIQKNIEHIQQFVSGKTLVVMCSEASILREAQLRLHTDIFSNIVDLSKEFKLSTVEKKEILQKYITCNDVAKSIESKHGNVNAFVAKVAGIASEIGYPHCVVMFTNPKLELIDTGWKFFECPVRHLNKLISRLYQSNPSLYAFMLLLTLCKGRLLEEDLADLCKDSPLITLLENTSVEPKDVMHWKFRDVISKYDSIYLKRFIEEGIVGFHHYSFMTAMRLHFCEKYQKDAITYLPFEFSYEIFKTDKYEGKENVVRLKARNYKSLAQKFTSEILSGNIQVICQHQACSDQDFAVMFSKHLKYHVKKGCRLSPFEIMERELEIKETFNGSILYWASVYKAKYLVAEILETGVLQRIKNSLWLKNQASAALVHACKHGFPKRTIEMLLELGAEILCQHHIGKVYETNFCDTCNIFDETGCSPLQAALMDGRTKRHQISTLKLLLNNLSNKIKNCSEGRLIITKALREAVMVNNDRAVELLFRWADFDINMEIGNGVVDDKSRSILWHAVCCQNRNLVHKFLPIGNIPEEMDESGKSMLMMAKDVETMKCLIEHGVSIDATDHYRRNVLFFLPDVKVAKYLIEEMKLEVNEKDILGMTPLHVLIQEDDDKKADIISTLLLHGADVFARDSENRFPLQLAQNTRFAELICRRLEQEGDDMYADIESMLISTFETVTEPIVLQKIMSRLKRFKNNYTIDLNHSLLSHAKNGLLTGELLSFYLKENIRFSISDDSGNILHHLCTNSDDQSLTNILEKMERGYIEVNGIDNQGNTPLHIACKLDENDISLKTRTSIIKFLFKQGAVVNIKNQSHETPLHFLLKTVCEGVSDILELLLSRNVDVNVQSLSGSTALQLLTNFEISSQLQQHEASVCVKKLLQHGAAIEMESLTSPTLLASCRTDVRVFEAFVHGMKKYDKAEILQILEHCFAKPNNSDSWEILQILKSQKVIKMCQNAGDESDCRASSLCITPDVVKSFSDKLQVECDIINMMLGIRDVKNKETIDKYFQYALRFGSDSAIDLIQNEEVDLEGKSYFIRFIHYIMSSGQARQRHKLECYDEGVKSEIHTLSSLLEYDIDINIKDDDGHSALYYIVISNMPDEIANEYVIILINHGADIHDELLLVTAANKIPRAKVLETLIKNSANKQKCDQQGRNVIFLLVDTFIEHYRSMGDITSSIRYLYQQGVAMNKKNDMGETILQYSVRRFTKYDSAHTLFQSAFVNVLLECEADPNVIDETSGETALHKAVMCNNYRETDLIKLLISKGGNKNATENVGRGLLHCAVLRMNHDSVKTTLYLLSIGLDVNAQDNEGNTPLHLLVQRCRYEENMFELNLESDHTWCSPLRISVMKCLLMSGADANITNKSGKTVLHMAVEQYKKDQNTSCHPKHLLIEMMAMLLSHDCDVTISDNEGKSAVDNAKEGLLIDIWKCLTKRISPEELLFPQYNRSRTRNEYEMTDNV